MISPKSAELFAPGHHVWVGENVTARTPIFCVVLKDGEYWEIEAEWPDGTIEPVYKFKAGLEALNWVKTESAAWVAERVAMGQPIISDTKRRRAPHLPSYRKTPAAKLVVGEAPKLPHSLIQAECSAGVNATPDRCPHHASRPE